MDQGPKDQNMETRDLSPADEGDNHDNVNLMDMELEPQLEDEIPSAADLLAGAFNISFATYEADLETSRKTTRPAEIDTLPFVNNVISSSALQAHASGEAAAALKKAEMQRKINELQSKSAMALELEEKKRREDKLAFARRKREEQARLESLRVEQEAATVVARAKAIDEGLGFGNEYQLPDLPVEEPRKRVEEFISSQLGESSPRGQKPSVLRFTAPGFTANLIKEEKPRRQELNTPRFTVPGFPAKSVKKEKQDPLEELNPGASPSTPSQTVQFSNPADRMECFIQFMARRELIANKIEKFDDRLENFNTWKVAFKNMTNDVNITASEELALMLEYTTGKSKIATATQFLRRESDCGGTRILEKAGRTFWLDRSYYQCASEQTHNVPCVGIQGQQRSARIGGLTVRVAVCKRRWWSSILDEPAFLKPVLAKLPEELQGRWQRHAYHFKSQHGVDYPPFREFASFIQEIAQEWNDPFLSMESHLEKFPVKPLVKPPIEPTDDPPFRQGFTTFRTDITDPALKSSTNRDPARWCVIHKLSHPLSKCRAFRAMPLTERKNLLSQHRICFHCLATTNHLAKDCGTQVKCSECHSDKHVTALHAGPPSKPAAEEVELKDAHQNGGEPAVTSSYTKVCGNTMGGKSCAKICLVSIYANSQPENKIKAYVVIDDQSNCSLAKSKLFDLLNLGGKATPYTLKTCSGTSQALGRRAHNLLIESFDGTQSHTLPICAVFDLRLH